MNKNLELAKKYEEEVIRNRREIHAHPEVGFYVPKTAEYIKKELQSMGIEPKDCGVLPEEINTKYRAMGFPDQKGATGVVATIGKGEPCVLLRGDIDALPMEETTGLPFAAKNGAMHACGHDTHAAMLLGAARILKEREEELPGTVKLCFQIGEEWGCGSKLMIDDGLLENPKVDAALAIHIQSQDKIGTAQYTKGVMTASMDTWQIDIQGKGGHSSMPQKCVDPLFIANQLYTALNLLPGREADPAKTFSLVVGVVEGGTAANIIPDTAGITASMRTLDPPTRDHLADRVKTITDHTVTMWRGDHTFLHFHTPSTFTDETLVEAMVPRLEGLFAPGNFYEVPPISGTEDFGYITKEVPGMMIWLGAGGEENYPHHNPNVSFDESVFKTGAALYATFAMECLDYLRN